MGDAGAIPVGFGSLPSSSVPSPFCYSTLILSRWVVLVLRFQLPLVSLGFVTVYSAVRYSLTRVADVHPVVFFAVSTPFRGAHRSRGR